MPEKTPAELAAEKAALEKLEASKKGKAGVVKYYKVTKRTTFRGRIVMPEVGKKPAFSARATTDKDGKTRFDNHSSWKEIPAPAKKK